MIHSMTAFSRGESRDQLGTLTCEMRSINHRYLEISLYLPEILRPLEMPVRELIRKFLKRGKIECVIRYQPNPEQKEVLFTVNTGLVKELCGASEKIASLIGNGAGPIYPVDILRFPGVLETKETDLNLLEDQLLKLLESTVKDLISARNREGEELKELFFQRLDLMQKQLAKVRELLPTVIKEQQERLIKRFKDAKTELDPNRFEQEMVIFAQKIDISEEIDRTETHINEIRRTINQGGTIGRRMDFLLQELNREANTLGSKSVDSTITHAAVEMKVLIEQIREQVQNIE